MPRVTAATLQAHIRRAQHGYPPSYPVVQAPNAPLLVALAGSVVSKVASGKASDYGSAVFYLGLAVWAYLELTDGTNAFRRVVGAAAIVYLVVRLAGALGD